MEILKGWKLDAMCRYACMCGRFRTEKLEDIDSHMSTEFEGFCVRGLKCIDEHKYICICGELFTERKKGKSPEYLAYEHVCKQMEKLTKVCMNMFRNKCQKCDKQLDSPQALRIHCQSKSHINFESKVSLHCEICDIRYYGQKQMLTHLQTNKHKKKLAMSSSVS
jgi:hypothetical protein